MNSLINRLVHESKYYLAASLGEYYISTFNVPDLYLVQNVAIAYFHISNKLRGLQLLNMIQDSKYCSESLLKQTVLNKTFYLEEVYTDSSYITMILPLITFTMTSCRRLSLFLKSVAGFIANCHDARLIYRWIVVDDNSSQQDRTVMKETFPFIDYVEKTWQDRGHAKSMQMLVRAVKSPFMVHIEDDCLLVDPRCYLKDMLEILRHDDAIGQVVFNHNYKENPADNIVGGTLHQTTHGTYYYKHEYCQTLEERDLFVAKNGNALSVNYYPHFSLQPSMIRTSIFEKLNFIDEICFEYKFAHRYTEQGYKTAFLPGYHFKHIGRLLKNANTLQCNAYDLVQTNQFYKKIVYKLVRTKEDIEAYPDYEGYIITTRQQADDLLQMIDRVMTILGNRQPHHIYFYSSDEDLLISETEPKDKDVVIEYMHNTNKVCVKQENTFYVFTNILTL